MQMLNKGDSISDIIKRFVAANAQDDAPINIEVCGIIVTVS